MAMGLDLFPFFHGCLWEVSLFEYTQVVPRFKVSGSEHTRLPGSSQVCDTLLKYNANVLEAKCRISMFCFFPRRRFMALPVCLQTDCVFLWLTLADHTRVCFQVRAT